jgi:hypothetical protein
MVPSSNTGTNDRPSVPSSPPLPSSSIAQHDRGLNDKPSLQLSSSSRPSQNSLLSPETKHLPPPVTPASRDTTSDYYTAAWGSPYDFSPSATRSAQTALSVQAPTSSDINDESPDPRFGLEHLIPPRKLDDDSPDPRFVLEHLFPSRLRNLHTAQPGLSPLAKVSQHVDYDDPLDSIEDSVTPRSRTQRWVDLPQRETSSEEDDFVGPVVTPRSQQKRWTQLPQREEKPAETTEWWSEESAPVSDQEERPVRAEKVTTSERRGHRSRESNRTLDQQSFWDILREKRGDDMSSLFASRWAETPPPAGDSGFSPPPKDGTKENVLQKSPEKVEQADPASMRASRWADTPPPNDEPFLPLPPMKSSNSNNFTQQAPAVPAKDDVFIEQAPQVPPKDSPVLKPAALPIPEPAPPSAKLIDVPTPTVEKSSAESELVKPAETPALEQASKQTIERTGPKTDDMAQPPPVPQKSRLQAEAPPPLKKSVSFRGRKVHIVIPRVDYTAAGLPKPLTEEEIRTRLQGFEDAGWSTRGFDVSHEQDDPVQVRPVWPAEAETRQVAKEDVQVVLPDLAKWRAYQDWLTEQKLAALGVSTGFDEPVVSQDMSRQSSAQYPPLPFSPPLLTGSAQSIGRPGMIRGHSHAMSVASPASPLNSPFGHMHRHSTVGGPVNLSALQSSLQQGIIPGVSPFNAGVFSFPGRSASPAQVAALRSELGSARGPGSPLSHEVFLPQDANGYFMDGRRSRQHSYSQSMYQPIMPGMNNSFISQAPSIRPTPALPELPEDEEEDEEEQEQPRTPEPEVEDTYVPPHKRAQADAEIMVPTPRGHRHNISEGLERDLLEREHRHQNSKGNWIEATQEEEEGSEGTNNERRRSSIMDAKSWRKPSIPTEEVKESPTKTFDTPDAEHNRKKSKTKLNVSATPFTFNPTLEFKPSFQFSAQPAPADFTFGMPPSQPDFTFGAPPSQPDFAYGTPTVPSRFAFGEPASATSGYDSDKFHHRARSSGNFNAAAPVFTPKMNSDFSFSTDGPTFEPSAAALEPGSVTFDPSETADDAIFGRVQIPDIVKPARRSKAVEIKRPEDPSSHSGTDFEDEEGRIAQSANAKKQRRGGDDGDRVPQFAEPTPAPPPPSKILGSNVDVPVPADASAFLDGIVEEAEHMEGTPPANELPTAQATVQKKHYHKHSHSLSGAARPFVPGFFQPAPTPVAEPEQPIRDHKHFASISELEEGELRESPNLSPTLTMATLQASRDRDITPMENPKKRASPFPHSANDRVSEEVRPEPDFNEIDAIMQHLNHEPAVEEPHQPTDIEEDEPRRLASPGAHPMPGVTYLPGWSRSDAPSPSPRRRRAPSFEQIDRTDSADQYRNNDWQHVNRLNKAEEVPTSDWSGILSPPDEEKLHQRSSFFDSRIDSVISRIFEERLQPLEESLRSLHSSVTKRTRSDDRQHKRGSSNVPSDADDEDDMDSAYLQRAISRGRDKRVDQIKAAVAEALREQSPKRPEAAPELADLHSVLADMKVSFARAASSSLELDDIRALVDEALHRQTQAIAPTSKDDSSKGELLVLESRLNETLAAALEEANQRRAVEEREAEARRLLRLAEEELRLTRETASDTKSRLRAIQEEREDILDRLQKTERELRNARDDHKDAEDRNEALEATLAEYRTSSNKWRQEISEGNREREELRATMAELDRQATANGQKTEMERAKLFATIASLESQAKVEQEKLAAEREHFDATIADLEAQAEKDREAAKVEREELRFAVSRLVAQSKADQESSKFGAQKEREEANATIATLEAQASQAQTERETSRQEQEKLAALVAQLQAQIAESQETFSAEREQFSVMSTTFENQAKEIEEASRRDHETLKATISSLEREAEQVREASQHEHDELRTAIEKLVHEAEQAREASNREREDLRAAIANLEQEADQARETSRREQEDIRAAFASSERQTSQEQEMSQREKESAQDTLVALQRDLETVQEDSRRERDELQSTITFLERQSEDHREASSGMKRRLEQLHSDIAAATGQFMSEKALWQSRENDLRNRQETLENQRATEVRERTQLEAELRAARASSLEVPELRHSLEQVRKSNASLEDLVRKLQGDIVEQQSLALRYERQFHESQESSRAEIHRTRMSLESDIEAANHQVNVVRAELESNLMKARGELENVRMEAETAKARHEHLMEQEEAVRREALRKVNHSNSVALDEARHKYESAAKDLESQHARALKHAHEDRHRVELFLGERLKLSDAKLQHYQDRVAHLEERLTVAKSAAQAAAQNAQTTKSGAALPSFSHMPDKVSPQALRESILVLQEQLQERELRIESLQSQVQEEGVAKVKERDTEIAWLRELLAVRMDELTDLANTLASPAFNREAVRDTAIRIRANLQMEQEEKERFNRPAPPQSVSGQALASLSNFASPKLASAFSKWRSSMESSTLKTQSRSSSMAGRSVTPSRAQQPASRRPAPVAAAAPGYPSGLMTPPATSIRNASPVPELAGKPGSTSMLSAANNRLHPRSSSKTSQFSAQSYLEPASVHLPKSRQSSNNTTTSRLVAESQQAQQHSRLNDSHLFREQSYDRDADENLAVAHMPTFDEDEDDEPGTNDDSLDDVADSQPPAFRTLDDELEDDEGYDEEEQHHDAHALTATAGIEA